MQEDKDSYRNMERDQQDHEIGDVLQVAEPLRHIIDDYKRLHDDFNLIGVPLKVTTFRGSSSSFVNIDSLASLANTAHFGGRVNIEKFQRQHHHAGNGLAHARHD